MATKAPNPELVETIDPRAALIELELLQTRMAALEAKASKLQAAVLAAGVGNTVKGSLHKVTVTQGSRPEFNVDLLKDNVSRRIFGKATRPVVVKAAWDALVATGAITDEVVALVFQSIPTQPYLVWSEL